MKVFIACFICLMPFFADANSLYPKACEAVSVREALRLQPQKSELIFIHNLTSADVWLTHPVADPHASAGWSSRLQPDHWSSLLLSKKDFVINCVESKPGHEQAIPCKGAIAVCRMLKFKKPRGKKASYWVAEDRPLSALTEAVAARGFKLKT